MKIYKSFSNIVECVIQYIENDLYEVENIWLLLNLKM